MTSLVKESVNFSPEHLARDKVPQVGLLPTQRTLVVLALNDLVAGTVETHGSGAAWHHHCVTQELLADGTQKVFRDSRLD